MKHVNQIFQGLHFQEVLDVSIFSHSCSSKVYDFFFLEFFFLFCFTLDHGHCELSIHLHKIPLPEGILKKIIMIVLSKSGRKLLGGKSELNRITDD